MPKSKNNKEKKEIKPREYQVKAIESFKNNDWMGILEMATGTGKTITSLLIAKNYVKEYDRIFLIILVPFTHLIEQWEENCEGMGFKDMVKCYGSKSSWVNILENRVRDFNIGITKIETVITTYKTASSKEFNHIISKIRGRSFLIGDECHYFGIKGLRNNKLDEIHAKLGLSATPDRWWDENGTSFLRNYFGDTVYEYDMEEAIRKNILTEYKYEPIIVDLTEEEVEKYERLTMRLIHLMNDNNKNKEDIEDINRKRSLIISKAINKKSILYDIFKSKKQEEVSNTLVYCAPGEINEITKTLSELGFRAHRFDSNVPSKERGKILRAFSNGEIQILVAIKCLDEGVDVPNTRVAYFLASTSNPREFIQRRGRILRKSQGKNLAEIYDFIVLPSTASENMFKSIASKELPRFAEFSRYAIDEFNAREIVRPLLRAYDLEHLMDKLPWDVYKEMKENWEETI